MRWDWVHLVLQPRSDLLYQPRMIDVVECGAVGGMRIGRENRITRRKTAPVPLDPPQIPHDLTWVRTRAAAVGNQRLTAWAIARSLQSQSDRFSWTHNQCQSCVMPLNERNTNFIFEFTTTTTNNNNNNNNDNNTPLPSQMSCKYIPIWVLYVGGLLLTYSFFLLEITNGVLLLFL
jgi:hypothetical protein